jgi:large subunit ribosomal protein L25
MALLNMEAEKREGIGKGHAKRIRNEGYVPGIIYGRGEESCAVKVNAIGFKKFINKNGISQMFELNIDGTDIPVIIKDIQKDPIKNQILHIDFQRLKMDEKIKMTLPITLIGREKIRIHPSIVLQQLDEIEIECLPIDIPQSVEADVSNLDFSTPFTVGDLAICKNENIDVLNDKDEPVAILTEPISEKELEELEEEEVVEEPEVIGEEKEEEGTPEE